MPILQIVHPLLKRSLGNVVKLIDPNDIIFRENLFRGFHLYNSIFLGGNLQLILTVHTDEAGLTMIKIITALTKVKIYNADGIDFLHLIIKVAELNMLCQSLGCTIEDTLQIVKLARELHFYNENLATVVFRLDIYAIKFVVISILVAFTLQQFHDMYRFTQQYRDETLQHTKVCLVAKHALHGPVKTDVFVLKVHKHSVFFVCKVKH